MSQVLLLFKCRRLAVARTSWDGLGDLCNAKWLWLPWGYWKRLMTSRILTWFGIINESSAALRQKLEWLDITLWMISCTSFHCNSFHLNRFSADYQKNLAKLKIKLLIKVSNCTWIRKNCNGLRVVVKKILHYACSANRTLMLYAQPYTLIYSSFKRY